MFHESVERPKLVLTMLLIVSLVQSNGMIRAVGIRLTRLHAVAWLSYKFAEERVNIEEDRLSCDGGVTGEGGREAGRRGVPTSNPTYILSLRGDLPTHEQHDNQQCCNEPRGRYVGNHHHSSIPMLLMTSS